jgi:prevent-host-death family protein
VQTIDMREATAQLSRLVDRAAAGEEIVITRGGEPVARLVAVPHLPIVRTPGSLRGQIQVAEDFDAPLPPEVLNTFSGDV